MGDSEVVGVISGVGATPYAQETQRSISSIVGLLGAHFLGTFNDNVYKMVISLLAVNAASSAGGSGGELPLIGAVFVLPFFLFSGYAGHVADVYSKRSVLVVTKAFEIAAMALGCLALLSAQLPVMLGVLFVMAMLASFFSPAKYSILPELVADKDLSRANGLLEMSGFLAIILGTALGGLMFDTWKEQPGLIGLILTVLAIGAAAVTLTLPHVPASGATKTFHLNPWAEITTGFKRLYSQKSLWLTVIGIAYFWFLGALFQMDILLFGKEILHLDDSRVGLLGAALAIGIGIGSVIAGRLSGDKVELGLVPLGSIGMGVFSFLLSRSTTSYTQTLTLLAFLGFSSGLFIVPLNASLQQKGEREEKGRLLATSNFLSTAGILLASGTLWLLRAQLHIPTDRIIFLIGLFTLLATAYVLRTLPDFLIRFSLWLLTHTLYKIRIIGQENVPFRGPALLVCNHISFVDGLLVGGCVQRFIRFMIYRLYYEMPAVHWLLRLMKAIPVQGGNPKEVVRSLELARDELRQGHVVCIFAEGSISRTGNFLPFKRGFERIMKGLENVPVIPVHLDRLWGSIFSFKDGRFLWKWPRRIPYPVTVSFGKPLSSTTTAEEARLAIAELGSAATQHRRTARDLLHLRFIETAKRRWFSFCIADSTGRELTYGKALLGSVLLSHWLRTHCAQDSMLGLMLPASVAGALANIATLLAAKVPVNLNFTAGREALTSAIQQCGIRTILTSRTFLAKAKIDELEGMVFVEDIMKEISSVQKIWTAIATFLLPSRLLQALYRRGKQTPDSLATVVFSSGSTGTPKGVMLSHHNVLSNVEGIEQVFWVTEQDCMMGVLPFFHSFGFTGTLWLPIIAGFGAVYHPNPLDAKTIGEMVKKHKATILISTPTFCGAYLRKCAAEEFASLRYTIVGAEKLPESTAKAFKEKYGLDLLEGYGCTEMAPVVSVNIPDVMHGKIRQTGFKSGTVGHPLPGVVAKVVDRETGQLLTSGEGGLLLVKGPNRMFGYLGQPEKTAEVLRDGWYLTGDIATIDEDGFIRITDRLSRFSKVGGEMVPHLKIEEAINQILGDRGCVVTAIPDEQRGERLAVLYTHNTITTDELWEQLCRTDLPRLWIPKREHFYAVEALPLLGTGKVDLRKAKLTAMAMMGMEVRKVS
jgi:acyl-[acyl-carrier-protein]-phospholipid O-acyltransferase/long-chain-fatty-acid--[acyl-carrier-protein] ligase